MAIQNTRFLNRVVMVKNNIPASHTVRNILSNDAADDASSRKGIYNSRDISKGIYTSFAGGAGKKLKILRKKIVGFLLSGNQF